MPPYLVQNKGVQDASGTSHVATLTSTPTPGNLLVQVMRPSSLIATVTYPTGWDTCIQDNESDGLGFSIHIIKRVVVAGDTTTVGTYTTTGSVASCTEIMEFATQEAVTDWALDKSNVNDAASASNSNLTGTTGTLSTADQVAVAMAGQGGTNGGTEVIDSGFTVLDTASFDLMVVGYKITSATTALNPLVSWVTTRQRTGGIATFTNGTVAIDDPERTNRFDRHIVTGHSYTDGIAQTAGEGIIDDHDILAHRFCGVVDTFTRADSTTIGPSELRAVTPVEQVGDWAIVGDELKCSSSGGAINVITWDTGWYDGEVKFTVGATTATAFGFGLILRYVDINNMVYLQCVPDSSAWQLRKVVAGVDSAVDASILKGTPVGAIVKAKLLGQRILIGRSDGTYHERIVPEFTGATKHGVHVYANDVANASFADITMSRIQNYGWTGAKMSQHTSTGGYRDILQYFPSGLGPNDLVTLVAGLNDSVFPNGTGPQLAFGQAMRTCLSRFRATHVYEDSDTTCAFSAGWSTTSTTNRNSGAGFHTSTTTGSTVTISVPASFAGGTIALLFIAPYDSTGGTATVTVDAVAAGTVTTTGFYQQAFGSGDFYNPVCLRLTGLAAGAHTIVVTVATVAGADGIWFDAWWPEASAALGPVVRVANIAHLPDDGGYAGFWSTTSDTIINTYQAVLYGVLAEFNPNFRDTDGLLQMVDIDAPMSKQLALFQSASPRTHPNDTGADILAQWFYRSVWCPMPTVTVQLSTTDPLATPSWLTMPGGTRASWRAGREAALDAFQPGVIVAELDNSDRSYDPLNTSSSFLNYLTPNRRLRLVWDHPVLTTASDAAHGWADDWPQTPRPFGYASTVITAPDAFGQLQGPAPQSLYEVDVFLDNPVALWWLDETQGNSLLDSSGNGFHLTADAALTEHSVDGIIPFVDRKAIEFPGTLSAVAPDLRLYQATVKTGTWTVEAWVDFALINVGNPAFLVGLGGGIAGKANAGIVLFAFLGSDGLITVQLQRYGATTVDYTYITDVTNNERHHIVADSAGNLYVDAATTGTVTGSFAGLGAFSGGSIGGDGKHTSIAFMYGTMAGIAVYDTALSAARVTAHYDAGLRPGDGDTTGTRVGRLLDYVSWPAAERDIDTGDTTLGPAELNAAKVLDLITKVERTEQGAFYQLPTGSLRFRSRNDPLTNTQSTTVQAEFTDDPDALVPAYRYDDLVIEPASRRQVRNYITINWAAGTTVVSDTASIASYGYCPTTIDGLWLSAEEAVSVGGDWVLDHNKDPHTRYAQLVLNPAGDARLWWPALNLRIGDRVSVRNQPQGTATVTVNECLVEGYAHEVDMDRGTWLTRFYLSPGDTRVYGLWDIGLWDSALWAT